MSNPAHRQPEGSQVPWDSKVVVRTIGERLKQLEGAMAIRLQELRDDYSTRFGSPLEAVEAAQRAMEERHAELKRDLERIEKENGELTSALAEARGELARAKAGEPPPQDPHSISVRESEPAMAGSDFRLSTLAAELGEAGFEVIDGRPKGNLWAVAAPAARAAVFQRLQERGITFQFAPRGSTATRGRLAWWTKASG